MNEEELDPSINTITPMAINGLNVNPPSPANIKPPPPPAPPPIPPDKK
jgi:hypothetical protein